MAAYIIIAIIAYLIGSINFSVIISKRMAGFDVREKGSGNAGTTNMLRSIGVKAAVITLLCDILKGVVVILIAILIGNIVDGLDDALLVQLAGIFVIIGHTFPIFFGFKGGKGIATTGGVIFAFHWQLGLICAAVFLIITIISKYVSLGSICMVLIIPFILYFNNPQDWKLVVVGCIFTAMAIWRHRANIVRLMNGTENKLGQKVKR